MEDFAYSDFARQLHQQGVSRRSPLNGIVEVTHRCPLRCVHCYNNLPAADEESRRSEMTPQEHRRVLDELTEAGCLWLLYTGGEIFLRPDFLDLYGYAKRRGFLVTLFTSGFLLDERTADFLAERRPFLVEMTLYGRSAATHERITGVRGSFDRVLKAVRLLQDRQVSLSLKAMVLRENAHEIWDLKRFAEEDLGVTFRFDPLVSPRVDCRAGPLASRLSPEEIVALDLRDPARMAGWKEVAEASAASRSAGPPSPTLYQCNAGVASFVIDPYGKMALCLLSQEAGYDLRRGSFREGWESSLLQARQSKVSRDTKCLRCGIRALCGMCPPGGALENRDPEEPVDFYCRLGHLRARALGLAVPPHGPCEHCAGQKEPAGLKHPARGSKPQGVPA
jgi:radical SAM protein with 4Fe4S-binding SPASM domain